LSLVMGPDHAPLSKRHGATSVAEFREQGILPEALVNYLTLLGWSPGEGQEMLPADEMARRFELANVSHSAAVFDTAKLAWMNRHYLKDADPARVSAMALPAFLARGFVAHETDLARQYIESLLPMALGSVDRPSEIADRVAFIFGWDLDTAVALIKAEADGERIIAALAEELWPLGPLNQETFRAAAGRVKDTTGLKGRALFHPIRVALTGLESGPELDLAVPAIDRGALLPSAAGIPAIPSCADRARAITDRLRR
jgi:glutamyl-tRNA synthetase/nondiscriminating glutamyl-tRNA synthetase